MTLDTIWNHELLQNREQKRQIRRMFVDWISNGWKGDFCNSQILSIDNGEGKLIQVMCKKQKIQVSECPSSHLQQEADNSIFYFALKAKSKKLLITSIDTDVFIISILQAGKFKNVNKKLILQLNHTLFFDPILAIDSLQKSVQIDGLTFVMLYALTGCDYTSAFAYISKNYFIEIFKTKVQ